MGLDLKIFSGIMDTDNSEYVIAPTSHAYAKNIVFRGTKNNLRPQNILGTTQINYTLPTGTTIRCIGAFYDAKKQRIFFFLYSSSTNSGIYILDTNTQTVTPLIVSNTSTDGDVLGFTLTKTVYNINVIYGDELQGDALYWLDSLKRPSYINIDKQLDGDYGTVERSFIDVAKPTFTAPPYVVYENDSSIVVNNLRRKLFKFKTRVVYLDNTKSVWSSHSEEPLPTDYIDTEVDSDPTKNCRIAIVVQTGDLTVKRIEIAAAESLGNLFSDFYLITVIDKDAQSIADNTTTIFRFYNNQAYTYIDLTDSVQEFDWVPQEADAQELLRGDRLIYGNVKEGYDLITLSSTGTPGNDELELIDNFNVLFNVSQSGEGGFGTGNIHTIVLGDVQIGNVFTIITTTKTITFTATVATTANVITGLSAAAVVAGFTVVSSDTENLVIVKTNEILQRFNANTSGSDDENFAYDWSSNYGFGIVYFDKKSRTNGVVYTSGLSVQTPAYSINGSFNPEITYINISISSRPPIWAVYYQIVRTKNLTKTRWTYWVTPLTFKDDKYAYLSIENLNQYIKENPSASFLAYDFATNDRIKIIKWYPSSDPTAAIVYPAAFNPTIKDFTIIGSLVDPIINGGIQKGQFIKIGLPSTNSLFDFGVQTYLGTPYDYSNYFIQLYTPALAVANGLDFYYEFGEKYAIGDEGTLTAFHQGMIQNQTPDLVTPATFRITKGDAYVKVRDIFAAPLLKWTLVEGDVGHIDVVIMNLDETFHAAGYEAQSTFASTDNTTNWMIDITDGNEYVFNIKGTITVKALNDSSDDYGFQLSWASDFVNLFDITPLIRDKVYTFDIDTQVTFIAGTGKIYLEGNSSPDGQGIVHVISGELTFTQVGQTFTETVIDQNFSDFFQSAVNSNGRAWIFDSNARQTTFGNVHRWGLNYEPTTNINRSNRFYGLNFIESDLAKGDILRYKTRGEMLKMFFTRGIGITGIYGKYIQNNQGVPQLVTTDDVLTQNNINYFSGEYGVGTQPTGLVSSATDDYFIDPVVGEHIKVTSKGIESISNLYYGKYYLRSLFTPYNKTWTRTDGSLAKIFGCYSFLENQCIMCLQSGTNGSDTIDNYAFSFNEQFKGYDTFYDFHPEMIVCAETKIYSWLNGNLYVHDNTTTYSNFYGVQYYPSIKSIWNKDEAVKKKYGSLGYQSNQIWVSDTNGDIYTSFFNPQTGLQQISQLNETDYVLEEGIRTAAFLYDANSGSDAQLALLEGDMLLGDWISINLIYKGSDFAFLYAPYVSWAISQKNF